MFDKAPVVPRSDPGFLTDMREYFPSLIRRSAGVQAVRKGVDLLIDMFVRLRDSLLEACCVLYISCAVCQTRCVLRDVVSLVTYDHSEECFG